jgi:hypothetical protein
VSAAAPQEEVTEAAVRAYTRDRARLIAAAQLAEQSGSVEFVLGILVEVICVNEDVAAHAIRALNAYASRP